MTTTNAPQLAPWDLVQQTRERAGLSREALARAVGVSLSTVHRLEVEHAIPKAYPLARICQHLELDPALLHSSLLEHGGP